MWRWKPDGRPPTWGNGYATARHGARRIAVTGSVFGAGSATADLILDQLTEHGVAGLRDLDGQFAFVFWDRESRRLIAGRDRFGGKTLYWQENADGLVIADRVSALGVGKPRLNVAAAVDFLVNGFTDQDDSTLIEGIHQLPPGSVLDLNLREWTPGAAGPAVREWCPLPAPDTLDLGPDEAAAEFRTRLRAAVRRAAPGALLLSGGLDSSAIAAFLPAEPAVPTYKAYFGVPEHDQAEVVAEVVARGGMTHHRAMVGGADLMRHRDTLVAALEVPYERSIIAAHWAVRARMAEDGVRVSLDGIGADEQLGGYVPWQRSFAAPRRGDHVPGLPFVSTSHPPGHLADPHAHLGWLAEDLRPVGAEAMRDERFPPIRSFGELCRHHLRFGALPMLLRQNREIGSAFGQDARSPFLDRSLVDLSIGLGGAHKLVNGHSKQVLRSAVRDLVPPRLLRRAEKVSYSGLEVAWLLDNSLDRLRAEADRAAEEWPDLLDPTALRASAAPSRPDKTTVLRLWRVTCFAAWARIFAVTG
ncbi:asparagine synthetase B family protein [Actinokineospora iranica]|uniref:asparagine synthase (glutamine-hydrolyzing) n=1 Tax=Actinokineospora iranica TaxID=1271860 RepID=A0A1G6XLF3_9PSEU|nr:asparagine synthase-related protein [Actinokineospora iranica]SDD79064.1 asparagine synthase (glutamine-hydrolyzing) [Actinokineospora iranica]